MKFFSNVYKCIQIICIKKFTSLFLTESNPLKKSINSTAKRSLLFKLFSSRYLRFLFRSLPFRLRIHLISRLLSRESSLRSKLSDMVCIASLAKTRSIFGKMQKKKIREKYYFFSCQTILPTPNHKNVKVVIISFGSSTKTSKGLYT